MVTSTTGDSTIFANNTWTTGAGTGIEVINPTDESVLAEVPSAGVDDVSGAIAAAWEARRAWADTPAVERSAYLRAIAALLAANREELAHMLVKEVGKPLTQAQWELDFAILYFGYVAEWDRRIEGEIVPADTPDEAIHLIRVPFGVVGAICPWNYPLALYARKVAPALLTGNTVVLKPSETAPLSSIALTRMIDRQIGLPPGVLNLVTGDRRVGALIVDDPRVSMISMTGHRDSGKSIMERAAKNLTRVSLELGGKAPFIVWRDADVSSAVRAGILARHANSGQVCTCAERIYVHKEVAEDFVTQYVAAAKQLRLGDPETDVDLGPLVSREQMEKAENAMAHALDEGAEPILAGGRPAGKEFARGYWYGPSVLTGVDQSMTIVREETFAPITPIQTVGSLEEVFDEANSSRYGLSAYLFTNDYRIVMAATHELECGELYINRANGEAVQGHHIGHKESGLGGEDGKYGVLKYTQLRTVYHHYGEDSHR